MSVFSVGLGWLGGILVIGVFFGVVGVVVFLIVFFLGIFFGVVGEGVGCLIVGGLIGLVFGAGIKK